MNNILIFSPTPSHPQNAGNRKRIYNVAKYLKILGNRIHFVYFTQEGLTDKQKVDMEREWDSLTIIKKEKDYKLRGEGVYLADDWYQDDIGPIVQKKCNEYFIDIVLIINLFQSKLFDYVPSHILKLIDAQEKFTDRHIMLQKNGINPDYYYTNEIEEKKALERADKILAIQDKEAEFFRTILSKPVEVLNHIEVSQYLNKKYSNLKTIGFIGSGNSINFKSINEFIDKFIIFVEKNNYNIILEIAGSICNKLNLEHKNIKLLGFVESEKDFYSSVDLIINPLITGTGLKIKSVEALSFGVPIISTKIGFDGLKSDLEAHDLDSIDEMLDEIEKIYNNSLKLNELSNKSKEIFHIYEKEIRKNIDDIFSNKKNILIITHINFWELDLGSRYRLYYLLEYLNKFFKITIAYINKRVNGDIEKINKIGYINKVCFIDELEESSSDEKKLNEFILKHKCVKPFFDKKLYSKMKTFLNDKRFDSIIFEYIHLSYFKPLFLNNQHLILDTHDIMNKRCEKFIVDGKKHWININEEEELNLLKEFHLNLAIQKSEFNYLVNRNISSLLVPHANKINDLKIKDEFKNIIFIGGNNEANLNAIIWFISNVWSYFKYIKLNLVIYGTVCTGIKSILDCGTYENLYLKGKIDDLDFVYNDANLIINPVKIGGGLKIKNVEALCYGLPLITTGEGAYGMEDGVNKAFLLANTVDEWVDLILSLMLSSKLRIQLSKNALEYAKNNFSDEVCYRELVEKIKESR